MFQNRKGKKLKNLKIPKIITKVIKYQNKIKIKIIQKSDDQVSSYILVICIYLNLFTKKPYFFNLGPSQ